MKNVVAGVVEVNCTCCSNADVLINHVQLGPTRMLCPTTGKTYLDRGDGVYQPDGQSIAPPTVIAAGSGVVASGGAQAMEARGEITTPPSDLLSDRPARTADKQRISLERATFAGDQ